MEKVFEIIADQFNIDRDELTEDTSIKYDLGVDSVDLVDLAMAFEDEFEIEISYEEVEKEVNTIGDIIEYLRSHGADI